MNTNNILSADILDILFDGRNKAYGAYDLRKTYNSRIAKALMGIAFLCLMLFVGTLLANNKPKKMLAPDLIDVTLTNEKLKDAKKIELPIEQPKPQTKPEHRVAVNIPVITPDALVNPEDEVKPVDEIENVKIGASTIAGSDLGDIVSVPVEKVGTGTGKSDVKGIGSEEEETFRTVQIEAEFPGGKAAWQKYLERNLNTQTPTENDAAPGKYSVIVSFIVDKTGAISDVKAENDPGFGTAVEAVRVIKKGPSWKPAVQNGRNVTYRARQQITFMVSGD